MKVTRERARGHSAQPANVCKITSGKGSRERAGVVWTDE
jgi:hypothetical protein